MHKDKIAAVRETAFSLAREGESGISTSEFQHWYNEVLNTLEEAEAIEEFKKIFKISELRLFLPERLESVQGDNYITKDNRLRSCLYEAAEFLLGLEK